MKTPRRIRWGLPILATPDRPARLQTRWSWVAFRWTWRIVEPNCTVALDGGDTKTWPEALALGLAALERHSLPRRPA